MRARACLCLALFAATAAADPSPKPYDIKPLRDHLQVFQDAHGGTYVVHIVAGNNEPEVFYGTGKALYLQTDSLMSHDGDAWSIRNYAPRSTYGYIERTKDGTFQKTCGGKDDAVLTELTGDKAKAVIDKATFLTTGMVHWSLLLARDDAGVYYYVDQLADVYGGKGYRVFVGKKGAMKQLPLTDVAVDGGGYVFSTKSGDLRLVKNTSGGDQTIAWIKGEKRMPLVMLDTYMEARLIFSELGIYTFLGTLCDNAG